jgi:hypothetical protein
VDLVAEAESWGWLNVSMIIKVRLAGSRDR